LRAELNRKLALAAVHSVLRRQRMPAFLIAT
jgi:hypothetical protein